jgi:hypothetical protein
MPPYTRVPSSRLPAYAALLCAVRGYTVHHLDLHGWLCTGEFALRLAFYDTLV